jgi:RimJ/RimL family protein N-acetyltransferase
MSEAWIATHARAFEDGRGACFAVVERGSDGLVGCIGLSIHAQHARAELGYWLGVPFWNCGYMTEAAVALLQYGFETLELQRIQSSHLSCNPASGRVMQKIGMQCEGTSRRAALKWGEFHDLVRYGILRDEWQAIKNST